MKAIAKLIIGGGALGFAYYMSKKDIQVDQGGIQRFSPDALKKVSRTLGHSEGADTAASQGPVGQGGRFALGVNPHADGSGPNLIKFINGVTADGSKVLVSKNILDEEAVARLQAVIVATSVQDAFDLGHEGSEFVLL